MKTLRFVLCVSLLLAAAERPGTESFAQKKTAPPPGPGENSGVREVLEYLNKESFPYGAEFPVWLETASHDRGKRPFLHTKDQGRAKLLGAWRAEFKSRGFFERDIFGVKIPSVTRGESREVPRHGQHRRLHVRRQRVGRTFQRGLPAPHQTLPAAEYEAEVELITAPPVPERTDAPAPVALPRRAAV